MVILHEIFSFLMQILQNQFHIFGPAFAWKIIFHCFLFTFLKGLDFQPAIISETEVFRYFTDGGPAGSLKPFPSLTS